METVGRVLASRAARREAFGALCAVWGLDDASAAKLGSEAPGWRQAEGLDVKVEALRKAVVDCAVGVADMSASCRPSALGGSLWSPECRSPGVCSCFLERWTPRSVVRATRRRKPAGARSCSLAGVGRQGAERHQEHGGGPRRAWAEASSRAHSHLGPERLGAQALRRVRLQGRSRTSGVAIAGPSPSAGRVPPLQGRSRTSGSQASEFDAFGFWRVSPVVHAEGPQVDRTTRCGTNRDDAVLQMAW